MRVPFLLTFMLYFFNLKSQGEKEYTSAHHFALGGATSTLSGNLNALDNQGTLSNEDSVSVSLAFKNDYFLSELSTYGLGVVYPTKSGTWGAIVTRFGNQYYSQNNLGLAYGRKLHDWFSFGMRLNYQTLQQNEYGNTKYATVEFGVLSKVSKNLSLGAHVYNPFRSKVVFEGEGYYRIGTVLRLGANYSLDQVSLLLDLESNTQSNLLLRSGLEYHVSKNIDLRLGFVFPQQQISTGFGFQLQGLDFDFYYQWHAVLGGSIGSTINYAF
jgi:hypothetical protein